MKEKQQDGPEEGFVIGLPPNEIQRRIALNCRSLGILKGRAIALRDQPRNWEVPERLERAQTDIQWQTGLLTAYEDAQTLEWGESPEEQQLRQERAIFSRTGKRTLGKFIQSTAKVFNRLQMGKVGNIIETGKINFCRA